MMARGPASPLAVDRELWDERSLLLHITERHFDVIDELGRLAHIWVVRPIEGRTASEALTGLNAHLHPLGWEARLRVDDPYALRIGARRRSLFAVDPRRLWPLWMFTLLSTWGVSIWWQDRLDAGASWTDRAIVLRALWAQALPLTAVPALAGLLERGLARRWGMRIGQLIPIPFPIPLGIWPYGLAAVSAMPRPDLLSWPDRRRLGWVPLVLPITLVAAGTLLMIPGLLLTSASAPPLEAAPHRLAWPLPLDIVQSLIVGSEASDLRAHWAHPLLLTAHGLVLLGWMQLLPFPGFAGGRLLVAILGPERARSKAMQFTLIGILLAILPISQYLFPNALVYLPWFFLLMMGLLLLFKDGTNHRDPRVLDLVAQPGPRERTWMAAVAAAILLLMLPWPTPILQTLEWEAQVEAVWPEQVAVAAGAVGIVIPLELDSAGLQAARWNLSAWTDDLSGLWLVTLQCPGEPMPATLATGCASSTPLGPGETARVELVVDVPHVKALRGPLTVHIVLNVAGEVRVHHLVVRPQVDVLPAEAWWTSEGTHEAPVLSTTVLFRAQPGPGSLSIAAPGWAIEMGAEVETQLASLVRHEVRVRGPAGGLQLLGIEPLWGEPVLDLEWRADNDTMLTWTLAIPRPHSGLVAPKNGWSVGVDGTATGWTWSADGTLRGHDVLPPPAWFLPGAVIRWHADGTPDCAPDGSVAATPPLQDPGNWTWMPDGGGGMIVPDVNAGRLRWTPPAEGTLLACGPTDPWRPAGAWALALGPAIAVVDEVGERVELAWNGTALVGPRGWLDPASGLNGSLNLTLRALQGDDVPVALEPHGRLQVMGGGWTVAGPEVVPGNGTATWHIEWDRLSPDDGLALWLEAEGDSLRLHLAAHPT